jgi:hypothetical protein
MATSTPVPLTALRARALHLPSVAPGKLCPVVPGRTVHPDLGPALGDGPVYLVGLGTEAVLDIAPAKNFESAEWGGNKTLYAVRPDYRGFILLRGHQLDGPNEVRFDRGDVPPAEQSFDAKPSPYVNEGWTIGGSYTRLRTPGCYAVQADGSTFSEVIVFVAHPAT